MTELILCLSEIEFSTVGTQRAEGCLGSCICYSEVFSLADRDDDEDAEYVGYTSK